MKNLKIIIYAIPFLIGLQAKAQLMKIIPANPTENDSIKIAFNITSATMSYFIQNSFSLTGNVVDYNICLDIIDPTYPSIHKDTILLNKLSSGKYVVNVTRYQSSSRVNCIPTDSITLTDSFYVAMAVSLPEHHLLQKLKIYPNPAKDYLEVENLENIKVNEIRIFDITGKLAKEVAVTEFKKLRIDLSGLNRGSYFLKLKTNEGKASKQFVIE